LTAGSVLVVDMAIGDLPPLPAATEVAAYRIVTEAVTNTVRHAHAAHCRVCVALADRMLTISVEDDGTGLPDTLPTTGNGLQTMRERAEEVRGHLHVSGSGGTVVRAELPLASVGALAAAGVGRA
jgi:signal transduction histidine kinase